MKIKNILYIFTGVALFYFAAQSAWLSKSLKRARAEIERLEYNQSQLLDEVDDYKRISLTRAELIASLTSRQDSLLRALKVKPKQVEKIVERWHHSVDTTQKAQLLASNDSLKKIIDDKIARDYPFIDKEGCFLFAGSVSIDDGLSLAVTRREYTNRSTEIAYLERSRRFLFIRYGPWRARLHINNECGDDQVIELVVVKNK